MVMANNVLNLYERYKDEFNAKLSEVMHSGNYILGNEVECFEKEWAEFIGTKYCVGVASGLDALWIGMKMLGIGEGDEVIVSANAYIACVMGITINHATPVFVEPDQYDNIDVNKIEKAITKKTKAILAVHLYGRSCDMLQITSIAKKYNLLVIEDCAQNHGGEFANQKVGTFGTIGCFSFYPTKTCGAFGDGGCIVTDDFEIAERIRIFRNYGSEKKYHNCVVGANSRLDEMQAGLLRVKLNHLSEIIQERTKIAERYFDRISNPYIQLPKVHSCDNPSWHLFVLHVIQGKRDDLIKHLDSKKITSMIHYPIPPYLAEAYTNLNLRKGSFPLAERYADEVLSIPFYNGLTEEEQDAVIEAINTFK